MKFGNPPVTFSYHLGAHFTDTNHIINSLIKDRSALAEAGVSLPLTRRFKDCLAENLNRYRAEHVPEEDQMVLYDFLDTEWHTRRVVISDPDLLSPPGLIMDQASPYSRGYFRSTWIRGLFPDNPCEFHICIRNPVLFLSNYFKTHFDQTALLEMIGNVKFESFWSDLLSRLRFRNPDSPIYVWCYEDSPWLWEQVLFQITGVNADFKFSGASDFLRSVVTDDGIAELNAIQDLLHGVTAAARMEYFSTLLSTFGIDEEEIFKPFLDCLGSHNLDTIMQAYENDLASVRLIDGLTLLE